MKSFLIFPALVYSLSLHAQIEVTKSSLSLKPGFQLHDKRIYHVPNNEKGRLLLETTSLKY